MVYHRGGNLMGILKFTTTEIENVLDGRLNNFHQDVVDNQTTEPSSNNISADTSIRWTNDGGNRNSTTAPTYMTDRWNTSTDIMKFTAELDSPVYVSDFSFTFHPQTTATGSITFRAYIDDPTTPKLIKTVVKSYKGETAIDGLLLTYYLGSSTGYDLKNDGIYFEIEFDQDGKIWGKSQVTYRT